MEKLYVHGIAIPINEQNGNYSASGFVVGKYTRCNAEGSHVIPYDVFIVFNPSTLETHHVYATSISVDVRTLNTL